MNFIPTKLTGVFLVEMQPRADARGFFARAFCVKELQDQGLRLQVVQSNVAFTHTAGTLRGLHYQLAPALETKLMRCAQGAIYDVVVDLRPQSPTYLQHLGVELTSANRRALFVPPLFAHGYQTLMDETEVSYLVDQFYNPACERGLRYDDARLGIRWPLPVTSLSEKDAAWPFVDSALATLCNAQ